MSTSYDNVKRRDWFVTVWPSPEQELLWSSGAVCGTNVFPFTPDMKYMSYIIECSKRNNVHAHIAVYFKNGVRMWTVKRLFGDSAHCERWKSQDPNNTREYIFKWTDKGNTPLWCEEFGDFPHQGHRTDWEDAQDQFSSGHSIRDVLVANPGLARYRAGLSLTQEIFSPVLQDRQVHVFMIWGPACAGKSYRAKQAFPDYFEAHGELNLRTFHSYRGQKCVIVDAFLSTQWPMTALESMIKEPVADVPVMYGSIKTTWTTFIITTNQHPDSMYTGAVNRDSLFLRLNGIFHVTRREDRGGEHIDFSVDNL